MSRSVLATIIRTAGAALSVGVQQMSGGSTTRKRRVRSLKGCQPCEAQKRVDQVMREVRGR